MRIPLAHTVWCMAASQPLRQDRPTNAIRPNRDPEDSHQVLLRVGDKRLVIVVRGSGVHGFDAELERSPSRWHRSRAGSRRELASHGYDGPSFPGRTR